MCRECFYFCVVVVKSALFPLRTNNLSHLGACVPMAEWERVGKDRVRRRVSNAIFSLLGCCFCLPSSFTLWPLARSLYNLLTLFFFLCFALHRCWRAKPTFPPPSSAPSQYSYLATSLLSVHVRPLKLLCCDSQFTSPPQ